MTTRLLFRQVDPSGKRLDLYGKEIGDPELHIDGAWGLTFSNGICKINLFTVAPFSEEGVERREVAVRLDMSVPVLFSMRDLFATFCQNLLDRGLIEEVTPGSLVVGSIDEKSPSGNDDEKQSP